MFKRILKYIGLCILFISLFTLADGICGEEVLAADTQTNFHTNILNEITNNFRTTAATWADKLKGYALTLFWMLASISLTWTAIELALKHAEFGEIVGELAKYIIFTGLFAFLLEQGPHIANLIFETFAKLGGIGAGLGTGSSGLPTMSPSEIVDVGLGFYDNVNSSLEWDWDTVANDLIQSIIAIIFFIFCLIIAIKVLVQLISLWCYMYAGAFLLGFGGSKWHREISINYFKGVLAASVKYFAMLFIVAIMKALMTNLLKDMSFQQPVATLQALALPIIFFMIMESVPDMMAGIVGGNFTSGPAASAVAGAMAGGVAGAATSTVMAAKGTASVARGTSKTIDYMANHSVSEGMKDLGSAISKSAPAKAVKEGAKNLGQIAKAGGNVSKAGANLAKGATQGTVRGISATTGFAKESLSNPINTGSAMINKGVSAGKTAMTAGKTAMTAGRNAIKSMTNSASEMGKSAFNSAREGLKNAVSQNITQPYQAGAKAAQSFQQGGAKASEPNKDYKIHDKGN
jgi:P-type conjugative transfer protein TrbL